MVLLQLLQEEFDTAVPDEGAFQWCGLLSNASLIDWTSLSAAPLHVVYTNLHGVALSRRQVRGCIR